MGDERQFCTFTLGDMFIGVEVQKVQEVIRYQEMTDVPLASSEISGLINLRGQIVTAIDLRRRFQIPDREGGVLPMNVVIRTDDGAVSLLVDEIEDVREVSGEDFERTPETIRGVARDLIQGVYKLDGKLLLILDIDRTVQVGDGCSALTEVQ